MNILHSIRFTGVVYIVISVVVSSLLPAQTNPNPVPPQTAPLIAGLKILVLEGQDGVNNVRLGSITVPVIEVRDQNDRPVERAEVTFRLPAVGPGGFFPGQALTEKVLTTAQGQAAATGFVPNHETGKFVIRVTAQSGNQFGEAVINQTNITETPKEAARLSRPKGWGWKRWALLIGVAGGLTAGIVLATRGGSGTAEVIGITPGVVTIGGGR